MIYAHFTLKTLLSSPFCQIYDVVNKVCTFKLVKLRSFIAFPLPSVETETNFLVLQPDLATK